jgi:hypothetical protein
MKGCNDSSPKRWIEERKTRGEVFITRGIYETYPDTFDFKSLYLHHGILSTIFDEAHSRNSEAKKQKVWTKKYAGYEYLVIGTEGPMQNKQEELAECLRFYA